MAQFGRKMSLTSRSLRTQLLVAFCLMSVIPILALLNYIFPSSFPRAPWPFVAFALVAMILLGFLLVKRIVDPILEITSQVKGIANGEVSRQISIARDDELGELSNALNQMTQHIKNHMDELKIYGERTKEINIQVNKQVNALSGLLQISNLIAKGTALKDIFEIAISRLTQVGNSSLAFLTFVQGEGFEVKAHFGLDAETLAAIVDPGEHFIFQVAFDVKHYLKIDKNAPRGAAEGLLKVFKAQNMLVYPIFIQNKPFGLLGVGNQLGGYEYLEDDVELINIFVKQLAIAIENDLLLRKVQDLEVKDPLTDLYNRRYMFTRLEEEILRAISHQQPCSFIDVKIKNLAEIQAKSGQGAKEELLRNMANLLKANVSNVNIDKVGRMDDDEFAMILPEKNKRQAQEVSALIHEKIQQTFRNFEPLKKPDVLITISENPIDGPDAASLIEKTKASFTTRAEV